VFTLHGTRKLLDRLHEPTTTPPARSTTALGDWYATVLFWKPQVALFVNEPTLLPVVIPFAPSATLVARFPAALETVLGERGIARTFIDHEVAAMSEHQLATTQNRSVVGVMNEFTRLAATARSNNGSDDLAAISRRLAETPCGPLYKSHVSPDREIVALAASKGTMHPRP
jgi:hypothetical protein